MQLFINNWSAVLTAPATASAASLSVPLADASKLTGLGAGDHYLLTLAALDGSGIEIAWEVVKVTASAAGILTVQRGQEGTTALDWVSASIISARATKGTFESLRATSGAVVGDSTPQPLGTPTPGTAASASREDHVHAKPVPADIGAATTAQGAKADTALQPEDLAITLDDIAISLDGKVDKDGTKVLSDQNYTAAEKAKLAGIDGPQFKGLHISLAALQAAHPTASAGNYADVDSGTGADVARYIWDVSDSKWVVQSGASGSMTAAQIKTAYESNPDTNAFSDAEQAKLVAIAAGATANATNAELRDRSTHTGTQTASTISDFASASRAQTEAELVAGTNVTITPSGSGATRQLTIAAAGGGGSTNLSTTTSTTTLTVNSDTGTDAVLPAATGSVAGVLTAADKTKLDGIATGATANANTDSLSEGSTNKYFTEIRVLATLMTGLTLIAGGAVSAADSLLVAVGKLQKQINDLFSGKQDTLVSGTTIKTVNGSSLLGSGNLSVAGGGGLAAFDVVAAEALAAGDFVNIYTDTGVAKARKADGGAAKRKAHGFVEASVLISATASVTPLGGDNSALSGLTPGGEYFLSTTTPGSVQSTAPNGSGLLRQTIGVAVSATQLTTINGLSVELA